MKNSIIVATNMGEALSLSAFLKLNASKQIALVIGDEAIAREASVVSSEVLWLDSKGEPGCNYASVAAKTLSGREFDALIGVASPDTRAVIGLIAAKLGKALTSNVISITEADGNLSVERGALDNKIIETAELPLSSCLLVNPIMLPAPEAPDKPVSAEICTVSGKGVAVAEYVSVETANTSCLKSAETIISVGLGATDESLFCQAKELAGALGAELGCSMPVAADMGLLSREHYIGISGEKVSPKLYIALGISGTSQHRAGIRNAKKIVCINKDPKVPFFTDVDYGIVGDLNDILPALLTALK